MQSEQQMSSSAATSAAGGSSSPAVPVPSLLSGETLPPSTSASSCSSSFCYGDIVKIHSLQSVEGRKLNNNIGTVIRPVPESGEDNRYEVHLLHFPATKCIKQVNLSRVFDTYVIKEKSEIPNSGRGVFATREILPGEPIVCERSLVPDVPSGLMGELPEHRLLDIISNDLTAPDREVMMKLAGGVDGKELTPSYFRKIANRNSFEFAGLCFVASHFNHSCVASASYEYDENLKKQVVFATAKINAGDEILVSYCGDPKQSSERKNRLATSGFTCTCSLCSRPKHEVAQIDNLLNEYWEIHRTFPKDQNWSRAEEMGERGLQIAQILLEKFHLRDMQRRQALLCAEIFLLVTQLDVQRSVLRSGEDVQQTDPYKRGMKWLKRYLELLTPACYASNSDKWKISIEKHQEFEKNPTKFRPQTLTGKLHTVFV